LGTLLLVISFVGVILAQRIGKVADSIWVKTYLKLET
jgi:hypothetical protein